MQDEIRHKGKSFHYILNFGNSRIYGRGKKRLMIDENGKAERTYHVNRKGSLELV